MFQEDLDDGWTDVNFDMGDNNDDDDDNDFEDQAMPSTAHVEVATPTQGDVQADSYEELVSKRVAAYVQQSQQYIESTDLAKRVRIWHESIAPKLEAVERRGDFDVHAYGTKIMDHFDQNNGGNPAKSAKTTYNFKELVVGKEKEEVARYFLSTLMLANTYNIELKNVVENKNVKLLPMDNIEITLLSTVRHHQQLAAMDYQVKFIRNG